MISPSVFEDHANFTHWEDRSRIAFVIANSVVLLFTSCVGIAANLFVISAVYHQKSLRTWNNALLVNLAVIDILRCTIDCPILLAIVLTKQHQGFAYGLLCDAQIASFSFNYCMQLLTLAGISAERYQAIAHPFQTSERRVRVTVIILFTWIIAILVALFSLTSLKDSPVYVQCRGLEVDLLPTFDTFGLYILIPLWSVCFAVIIGFYARIFAMVRAHSRKIFDKGSFPPPKQNNITDIASQVHEGNPSDCTNVQEDFRDKKERTNEVTTAPEQQVMPSEIKATVNSEEAAAVPTNSCKDTIGAKIPVSNGQLSPSKRKHPHVTFIEGGLTLTDLEEGTAARAGLEESSALKLQSVGSEVEVLTVPGTETETTNPVTNGVQDPQVDVDGAVCMMPSFASKERAKTKKESKLAKRSGYIIISFLVFWMPLLITILINSFTNHEKLGGIKILHDLEVFSVSVACVTSVSNPITYAVVNPQFRTVFNHFKTNCKSCCSR